MLFKTTIFQIGAAVTELKSEVQSLRDLRDFRPTQRCSITKTLLNNLI